VFVGHHAEIVIGVLVADPVFEGFFAGCVGEEGVVGRIHDGGVDSGSGPVTCVVDAEGGGVDASTRDAEQVDAAVVDGMYFGDLIDDGVEVGRAVNLGVPEGVVERLGGDDDEALLGSEALPGTDDVGRPAALFVEENDGRERLVGIGGGGDLIAVVALLAAEGKGAVLGFVLGLSQRRAGRREGRGEYRR